MVLKMEYLVVEVAVELQIMFHLDQVVVEMQEQAAVEMVEIHPIDQEIQLEIMQQLTLVVVEVEVLMSLLKVLVVLVEVELY